MPPSNSIFREPPRSEAGLSGTLRVLPRAQGLAPRTTLGDASVLPVTLRPSLGNWTSNNGIPVSCATSSWTSKRHRNSSYHRRRTPFPSVRARLIGTGSNSSDCGWSHSTAITIRHPDAWSTGAQRRASVLKSSQVMHVRTGRSASICSRIFFVQTVKSEGRVLHKSAPSGELE